MKNPEKYILTTLFSLLDGSIVYNSSTIPVYQEEGVDLLGIQILTKTYNDSDSSNKERFGGNASVIIEVIDENNDGRAIDAVNVAGLVMDLLQTTRKADVLSGTDFTVVMKGRPSISGLKEDSGSNTKIIRRILRYNFLIIEK